MADPSQQTLALIPHVYEGEVIRQRSRDGFINATAMCRVAGREWSHYREIKATKAFMAALALDLGVAEAQLAVTRLGTPGGDARNQGTWVHPQVAVHPLDTVSAASLALSLQLMRNGTSHALPLEVRRRKCDLRLAFAVSALPGRPFATSR